MSPDTHPKDHREFHSRGAPEAYDYTTLAKFIECPRSCYFFLRGFEPKNRPDYFVAGGAWQEALIKWYETPGDETTRLSEALSAMVPLYGSVDPESLHPKRTLSNLSELMRRYATQYPAEQWEPIQMEIGFRFPMEDFLYSGSVDGYIKWPGYGLLVLENKTTLGYLTDRVASQWQMGWQPTGYIWALQQITENVWGCLFNVASLNIPARPSTKRDLFMRFMETRSHWAMTEWLHAVRDTVSRIRSQYTNNHLWPRTGQFCMGGYGLKPCFYNRICATDIPHTEVVPEAYGLTQREHIWKPWARASDSTD